MSRHARGLPRAGRGWYALGVIFAAVPAAGVIATTAQALDLQDPVTAPDTGTGVVAPPTSTWSSPFALQGVSSDALGSAALQDPSGAVEAPSLRTADTKTYVTETGEEITRFFNGSVNYRDDTGNWKTIDNAFVPAESAGYAYRNKANRFVFEVPQDLRAPVRFSANGATSTMALQGAQGAGTVSANRASFQNALPGITVEYAVGNDAVKESLILQRPDVAQSFRFFLATPSGVSARKSDDGSVDFDRDGRTVFSLAPPELWDGSGSPSAISPKVDVHLEKASDGFYVTLTPDAAWLSSPDRVWPVVLDPTIDLNPGGECTIYRSGSPLRRCHAPNYSWLEVGSHGSASSTVRSLVRFDLASIPGDANVLSATFGAYLSHAPAAPAAVSLYRVSRDWNTGVSWTTSDGTATWTQPGGDYTTLPPTGNPPAPTDPTVLVTSGSISWQRWDVKQFVQAWLSGSVRNYGMIMKTPEATAADDYTTFYSSSFGAFMPSFWSGFWPYLDVKWKPQGRYESTPQKTWVVDGGSGDTPRVNAIKTLDKTVYVGGDFSAVGPRTGSFALLKASSDASYEPAIPEFAGTAGTPSGGAVPVRAIAPDGSGGWYIGGDFKYIGGRMWPRLAHIKSDGTLDQNWRPEPNGDVWALTLSGSTLYVGGSFSVIGGENRRAIAKLTASSGAVDATWNAGVADGTVRAIALNPPGQMFIGGSFTSVQGQARGGLAGLDPSGGWLLSMNQPVSSGGTVRALAVGSGNLYVGGAFNTLGGVPLTQNLTRVGLGTGSVDSGWTPRPNGSVEALQTDSAGRLYVGGGFDPIGGQGGRGLAAFTLSTGAIDPNWSPSPNGANLAVVRSLAVSGSTLYAGGSFKYSGNLIAVDSITGSWKQWSPKMGNPVYAVALNCTANCQGSGDHIAVGGTFRSANVVARANLASFNADTGPPTSWAPTPDGPVDALELARGALYVGGSGWGGQAYLRKFRTDTGDADPYWRPNIGGEVYALHATADALYVAAGSITFPDNTSSPVAAWSLNTGALINAWRPRPNAQVRAIESEGNTIFLAGSFTSIQAQPRQGLAAVNGSPVAPCDVPSPPTGCPSPGAPTGWAPNPSGGGVNALAVSAGKIYVGGDFTGIAGTGTARLATFSTASGGGAIDSGWNPQPNDSVDALAADGAAVYAGGRFSQVAGLQRSGLAAIEPANGTALQPLSPLTEVGPGSGQSSGTVRAIDITDSTLWAGGDWYAIGSAAQSGLAAFPGYGYMLEPAPATRTRRRLTLRAATSTTLFNRVRFEYKSGSEGWAAIPVDRVQDASNGSVSAWPLALSNGVAPTLVWDMPGTTRPLPEHGINWQNGEVEVRAVFIEPNDQEYASASVKVTLDQDAAGTADATEPIGPGSLDLLSGNFSLARDDVSQNASKSDLTFSRTYNSRKPDAGAGGPFGPGWLSSLPSDAAQSAYARLDVETIQTDDDEFEVVTVTASDGSKFTFIYFDGQYWPDPGSEDLLLTKSGSQYSVENLDGDITIFGSDGTSGGFVPTEVRQPGSDTTTTYGYEPVCNGCSQLRIKYLFPPGSGSSCVGYNDTPAQGAPLGCRYLAFGYCTQTGSGCYAGRLASVGIAATTRGGAGWYSIPQAYYSYDSSGRLISATEPAVGLLGPLPSELPARHEDYSYDAAGHITSVAPPGQAPWTVAYAATPSDPNSGRLRSVERRDPNFGVPARTTVLYQVPVSGSFTAYQMSASDVATWGQGDIPTDATAIFPPNHEPVSPANQVPNLISSEYQYASVHYMDRYGREVNVASPGGGSSGYITTTEWDAHNNVTRSLSASNRLRALGAGSNSTLVSRTLDTQRTYSSDGIDLLTETGPLHWVQHPVDDQWIQARQVKTYTYDEGLPAGAAPLHLLTKIVEKADSGRDPRTTSYGYFDDGLDKGIRLRKPTSVTVDPGGLNLTTSMRYNDDGLETEHRTPKASAQGNDAHTTQTIYYTAGSNSQDSDCGNRPEWKDLPCKMRPGGQPSSGRPLPVSTFEYDFLNLVTKRTDTVGSSSRVTTTTNDDLGRVRSQRTTSTGAGADLPDVTTTYDAATGQVASTSTSDGTIRRDYDALGRLYKYTDADGSGTKTQFDVYGRRSDTIVYRGTVGSSPIIGSQTYGYDPVSNRLNDIRLSSVGDFTARYDADGQIAEQVYPNDLKATTTYDETGVPTSLQYVKQTNCSTSCLWLTFNIRESIHGQWVKQTGSLGDQDFKYDQAGRLQLVNDTPPGQCRTTRVYHYDGDSNRDWSQSQRAASCGGDSPLQTYSYDEADRLTGSDVTYDDFGRITGLGGQYAGGKALTTEYFANDLVKRQKQCLNSSPCSLDDDSSLGVLNTYQLDPLLRQRSRVQKTSSSTQTESYHYSDESDSPSWIGSGSAGADWSRNVADFAGNLTAIQKSDGTTTLQLTDLHGDVVATCGAAPGAPLDSMFDTDEFGVPRRGESHKYSWLGGKGRRTELPNGTVQMGVRSYVPQLGRFLQSDPVPGGSANDYDYVEQDPVNKLDVQGTFVQCGLFASKIKAKSKKRHGKRYVAVTGSGTQICNPMPGKGVITTQHVHTCIQLFVGLTEAWHDMKCNRGVKQGYGKLKVGAGWRCPHGSTVYVRLYVYGDFSTKSGAFDWNYKYSPGTKLVC